MSTTESRMVVERNFVEYILDNYGNRIIEARQWKHLNKKSIWEAFEDGLVQVETLLEVAISIIGNIETKSIIGMDFEDKSDAKKVTLSKYKNSSCKNSWRYEYAISKVDAKVGKLRVMGYNPYKDKFDFFVIPNYVYDGIKYLKITVNNKSLEVDTTSKYGKWKVGSFEAMANL